MTGSGNGLTASGTGLTGIDLPPTCINICMQKFRFPPVFQNTSRQRGDQPGPRSNIN